MAQYEVQGTDENIDVRGETRKPGDVVELAPEDAAELVESGVLKEVTGNADASPGGASTDAAPTGESAPVAPAGSDVAGGASPSTDAAPEAPAGGGE